MSTGDAERLERVLRHLDGFSRALSHDLRAPLANVASFAQLLPTVEDLGPQGTMMADRMAFNTRRAAHMVDAIMRHIRLIGREVVDPEPVDLDALMVRVDESLSDELATAGADLEWGELPVVAGDADSLELLLRILVDNALRYRRPDQPGHVRVDATADADRALVEITVVDDGPGIPAEKRQSAFELGTRLVDVAGPVEGAGIGLATAQVIVENHGGSIEIDSSVPGEGTTVCVRLPMVG